MPNIFLSDQPIKIIDRTLPEMIYSKDTVKRLDIISMCWFLKELGVHTIEINRQVVEKMHVLPKGLDFLYRISADEKVDPLILQRVNGFIITRRELYKTGWLEFLAERNPDITLEIRIEELTRVKKLKRLLQKGWLKDIKTIRILGMNRFFSSEWVEFLRNVCNDMRIGMDICPENRFSNATAIALEAVEGHFDAVTVSFSGFSRRIYGYAALEEVLTGSEVLLKCGLKTNLKVLPEGCNLFMKMMKLSIPNGKPIIGKDIFKYESGIHADGIEKNPTTYEPFDPGMVGKKRNLAIGKHSGTKAIIRKLKELGIECGIEEANRILELVRKRSIEKNGELLDRDLKEIYKVVYDGY